LLLDLLRDECFVLEKEEETKTPTFDTDIVFYWVIKSKIMLEIRGHARGGQGMVTAFEVLAKIFSKLDDYEVQSFPAFGVERTGAPIQAFLRVARKDILNRSNVYTPDFIVIFDESLLDQVPVFDGLKKNGSLLLNTNKNIKGFKGQCDNVYTIPATKISLDLGLGSKSLPIVNAAMIGAIMRILEADVSIAKKVVKENVPVKAEANASSTEIAYEKVLGLDNSNTHLLEALNTTEEAEHEIFEFTPEPAHVQDPKYKVPVWNEPMSKNKTGNWRLLTPSYTTKKPPCTHNCPAGTSVREFVKLAGEQKFDEAFDVIYEHNPFPSICGRVCPHFCEQNCNRNELDSGLNIGAIERFVGDRKLDLDIRQAPVKFNKKVAVIGSGPAGLTAALRLRKKGYPTTVFEALPQAGGMMRTGIPKFRLPDNILDKEIEQIEKAGVEIVLNKRATIEALSNEFDVVITAVGSHVGSTMHMDNENLVIEGISFLREFKLFGEDKGIKKGEEVAVIGGGNTAIDVSRTLLRLGAKPTIYYRRSHKQMPAIPQEVEEARQENVQFEFLSAPIAIAKNENGQIDLGLIQMELGERDESGRRRPVKIEGSEKFIKVDRVITAIGQKFDDFVFSGFKVEPKQGRVDYNQDVPVFCAGDMAWGGTVTEAIGSGNKVAEEVDAFLQEKPYSHEEILPEVVLPDDINFAYYLPSARHDNKVYHPKDFYGDFTEVMAPLTADDIKDESTRCLSCGDCYNCYNCFNYCPDAAVHVDEEGRLRIDYDYCKGCGICVNECPSSAMDFSMS
jgi:2-oxoacid:acceptor oxidoreductase gamma subunit (pyruvate/2-ketoisovalerate family)/2-oxoacid:acceptor oxidoreductase delta subunit (pyruvate/2-ketoisovalerate family)